MRAYLPAYMPKGNWIQYKSPIQNSALGAWKNKNLKCSLKQVGMNRGLWELWVPVENTRESSIAYVSESEVSQSCLTLCDPVDCSPPGSSVRGILQVRILEWVAISFSRGSSGPRDQTQVSRTAGRRFNLWATSPHHNPEVGPIVVPTSQRRKPRQLNFSRSKERSNSNYSREFKLPQSIFQNPWV